MRWGKTLVLVAPGGQCSLLCPCFLCVTNDFNLLSLRGNSVSCWKQDWVILNWFWGYNSTFFSSLLFSSFSCSTHFRFGVTEIVVKITKTLLVEWPCGYTLFSMHLNFFLCKIKLNSSCWVVTKLKCVDKMQIINKLFSLYTSQRKIFICNLSYL